MVFKWWQRRRDAQRIKKVKPGDGSTLKPYRLWQVLGRSLFFLRRDMPGAPSQVYAYDIDYFSWDGLIREYTDGVQTATSTSPALFVVPGGVVEITVGSVGLTRMHFVPETTDEAPRTLQPHRNSGEGLRTRLEQRAPKLSRAIGFTAIIVLIAGLALAVPQLLELLTQLDWVAEHFGTFASPITLPAWANTSIFILGMLAALERALTLRNHWLIDIETWWLG